MILTTCAACAAPLAHNAPRCVRCKVRYCDSTCQHDHWRRGHKQMCKKIHRGGNAEQYNADKKYKEAVAVAVEKCAADTKGQTCYICTQALHWKTKEGLVRGCSCRGTAGFAHVSCLAEQAKILVAEAEENNQDYAMNERWSRWHSCNLCKQRHHGVVTWALGWACWKTYLGRPETDRARCFAMTQLGNGLVLASLHAEAVTVQEAELDTARRVGAPESHLLVVQGNLANSYRQLGREEEAANMLRDVHSGRLKLDGAEHRQTIAAAVLYAMSLLQLQRFEEVSALMRKTIPVAQRKLGAEDLYTLTARRVYAQRIYEDEGASLDDVREAVTMLEEAAPISRRVLGGMHPLTMQIETILKYLRAGWRDTPPANA